jgi:DNA-binding LytR/AlgR family response regulator
MRFLVIEDEKLAADRLIQLVLAIVPEATCAGKTDSVKSSVRWFENNEKPDLVFMDIQLADGLSFSIFEKVKVETPVIFTTAYNEYALKAFKVNSIDYLLKPIDEDELKAAVAKFQKLNTHAGKVNVMQQELVRQVMDMIRNPYKSRFVIRLGEHIKAIHTDEISVFYSNEKSTFIRTLAGRDFALDSSLDQLENEVDPQKYFRVSRKYIVSLTAIRDIISYSGSRLKLIINGAQSDEILVSREKVADFKKWLET